MATEAALGKVAQAAGERARGARVSRTTALLASLVVAVAAAAATYKILRSGDDE
jgi:hypothetical protein